MELEKCLKTAGNISFWWRDDDVCAPKKKLITLTNIRYERRLERTLKLLAKYNIPGIFAVIPKNFLEHKGGQFELIQKYNTFIALHGTEHVNKSKTGPKSEFPDDCDVQKTLREILENKTKFEEVFKDRLLPMFVPPFNSICALLKQQLLGNGFAAVSVINAGTHEPYNVDIDFMDWNARKLRPEREILAQIINLIKNGQTTIGFNNHHHAINMCSFKFLEKLVRTLSGFDNVKWVLPF